MKKIFVLLGAVALVVAFTAPSFAAEWSFYGSARIQTWWESDDFGDFVNAAGEDDDLDLNHSLQGNSRIGANVKVSDNLVGVFEYGSTPNLRKLYGEYDFGGFKLLVGQTYTPLNWFYSNQVFAVDTNLLPYGGVYNGRRAMIEGTFGGLNIALVQPVTDPLPSIITVPPIPVFENAETDVTIPQLQAKYTFKVAGLKIEVAGGYQTYDAVDENGDDEDINSYIIAIGGTYRTGPFFVGANYWMGQNVGNMGMWNEGFDEAIWDGDEVLDTDGYGFILVASFTLSDMLTFEGGYGYSNFDTDDADEEDDTSSYYVNATVNLAKGVFIVPEIGIVDRGDDALGNDEGDTTYYGLKWQINF